LIKNYVPLDIPDGKLFRNVDSKRFVHRTYKINKKVNILYIVLIVNINLKYVSGFYIMYKRIWAIMAKKAASNVENNLPPIIFAMYFSGRCRALK